MNGEAKLRGEIAMTETAKKRVFQVKEALIAVVAIVAVLLAAVGVAVGGCLANCAIGRAGDGGDRNVEEVVIEAEGTEARIEPEYAAQAKETAEFLNAVPGEPVEITVADGVHLVGIVCGHYVSNSASAPASSQVPPASGTSTPDSPQEPFHSNASALTDS